MRLNYFFAFFLLLLLAGLSCKQKPKVIEEIATPSGQTTSQGGSGIFSEAEAGEASVPPVTDEVHAVKVLEVLPTERYVYLKVIEDGREYWVATSKGHFEVGKDYFYKSGIYKRHFKSTEYNRIFEELYLVSSIVPADHSQMAGAQAEGVAEQATALSSEEIRKMVEVPGSIKIGELLANPGKYAGKEVQISGLCTKVNPNIMGRNWLHLKDGSKDSYDFVVTSSTLVPEGHVVTMRGVVAVNKDFGAGYRYELIVENAEIVKPNGE